MTERERMVLTSPDHFVAAIPHLVGFMPERSLVVACFEPSDSALRDTKLMVVGRLDLPTVDPAGSVTWAAKVAESIAGTGTRSVLVAVVDESATPSGGYPWPHQDAVDNFVTALEARDVATLDILYTDGERRWSIGCEEASCCPSEGVAISSETRTLVDAEFAFASNEPVLTSRAALVDEVSAGEVGGVRDLLERFVAERPDREADTLDADQWRMAQVDMLQTIAAWPERMGAEDIANVAGALTDTRVRDTFLRDLAEPGSNTAGAIAMLQTTSKGAPTAFVTPPATVLAQLHFWNGDGARANVALDRAAEYGQEYSFASLTRMAVASGIPPASFRALTLELSRDECFYGRDRYAAMAAPAGVGAPPQSVQPISPDQGIAL